MLGFKLNFVSKSGPWKLDARHDIFQILNVDYD